MINFRLNVSDICVQCPLSLVVCSALSLSLLASLPHHTCPFRHLEPYLILYVPELQVQVGAPTLDFCLLPS